MICDVMRRMNALSSTTSTRGFAGIDPASTLEDTRTLAQRTHLDATREHVEVHAASVVAAGILGDDRHMRGGENVTHRGDVPLTDVDAARGDQVAEHARA